MFLDCFNLQIPMPLKRTHCFWVLTSTLLSLPNTLMESAPHKAGQDRSSKRAGTSQSGSSASTFSSPSRPPPYYSSSLHSSRKENAEDLWKEINLASLHDYPITTTGTPTNSTTTPSVAKPRSFRGSMFLDCLGEGSDASSDGTRMGTSLSLNSGSGCKYIGTNMAGPLTSSGKKRVHENADENADKFHEKKFKRLMKNRESAARSRARKQAYTSELELEVARLQQENGRLRRFKEMVTRKQPCPPSV